MNSKEARIQARIDLDQVELERYLSLSLQNSHADWFEQAENVYQNGKHAGAYAMLHLKAPLDHEVVLPEPTGSMYTNGLDDKDASTHAYYDLNVIGATDASYGTPVHGVMRTSDPAKHLDKGVTNTLTVHYTDGVMCDPNGIRDDCFAEEGGAILEGYGAIDYTYDPKADNKFSHSLKGYSEEEGMRMYYCEHHGGCGKYQEYQHYFEYYGVLDYGNLWIEAAFAGTATGTDHSRRFPDEILARGNVDFTLFSKRARTAAIKTATVAMNVFTAVNRLMVEYGLNGCRKHTKDYVSHKNPHSMDSVLDAWDQAVATYTGSALFWDDEGSESNTGSLYYNMVDELARDFGAIEQKSFPHRSTVNKYIMDEFVQGKSALKQGDCEAMGGVEKAYYMILHKMRVPWVQGFLRSAFVLSLEEDYFDDQRREEERGKGAAFLAALLPDLHLCQPNTAQTVYDLFRASYGTNERPDYYRIRELLEPHYECLGVTCDDVGGLLDPESGDYYPGTHPCGGYGTKITQRRESVVSESTSSFAAPSSPAAAPASSSKGLSVASFFGFAVLVFGASLAVLVVVVRDRSAGRRVSLSGAAQQVVSGAGSMADYWMSRNGNGNGSRFSPSGNGLYEARYNLHENLDNYNDYDVQLRSMGEPSQQQRNDFQLA